MRGTYAEFALKDGRSVTLRQPRWEDLDDMVEFINGLVDEGTYIVKTKKVTREAEAEWLSRHLADVEKRAVIGVVAEVEGKAIGNSEVGKGMEAQDHVGFLGIAVSRGYRDLGIGARMMETLIGESSRAGLKLLVLDVAARNARAHHLYLKMGFKDVGTVPRMMLTRGEYGDVTRMYLEL